MTQEQYESIIEEFDLSAEYFVWKISNCDESMDEEQRLKQFYESEVEPSIDNESEEAKVIAIMQHTDQTYSDAYFDLDRSFKVLTDSEADGLLDDRLDDYLNDHILSQIPTELRIYFDSEGWKYDNNSDRGSWLNYVNGSEYDETVNGVTYYLYNC